jgi:cardiolipin synthase
VEPAAGRGEVARPGGAGAGEGGPPDAGPWTVPNALTALRLALAPVFLVLYLTGHTRRALLAFAVAAATDLVDGLAARLLRQHSRLGEFLDPIADKLLAFCILVALVAAGRLPAWLAVLVIGRDVAIVATAVALQAMGREVPVQPTRAGKYASAALAALVVLVLAGDVGLAPRERVQGWVAALGLLAAACTTISWVQYGRILAGELRRVRRPAPAP